MTLIEYLQHTRKQWRALAGDDNWDLYNIRLAVWGELPDSEP